MFMSPDKYTSMFGRGRAKSSVTDNQLSNRYSILGHGAYRGSYRRIAKTGTRHGRPDAYRSRYRARRRRRIYGRGLYGGHGGFWDDLKGIGQAAWNASSGLRTNLVNQGLAHENPVWRGLAGAGRALGLGAYKTNGIVNGGGDAPEEVPSFAPENDQGVTISNKEFVADVFGPADTGAFQNITYNINPGLFRTFPWLSQVVSNYEEYEMKQLIFTYKPTITDFVSTNGQVGTITLATQYNPNDVPFQTRNDMMHYNDAMSAKCSEGMLHGVECDPSKNAGAPGKFVRTGPVLTTQDINQYDQGVLNVAVQNTPAEFNNQALGELWVSYTVCARKPKFETAEGGSIVRELFLLPTPSSGSGSKLTDIVTNNTFWQAQQNRIGTHLSVTGSTILVTLPAQFAATIRIKIVLFVPSQAGTTSLVFAALNPVAMFPVNDFLQIGGTWGNSSAGATGIAATTAGTIVWESHHRIITPTSAASTADNQFKIGLANSSGTGAESTVVGGYIELEVYNHAFNYTNGSRVMVVNPVTQQLVQV